MSSAKQEKLDEAVDMLKKAQSLIYQCRFTEPANDKESSLSLEAIELGIARVIYDVELVEVD